MGCHTWTAIKASLTTEEIYNRLKQNANSCIKFSKIITIPDEDLTEEELKEKEALYKSAPYLFTPSGIKYQWDYYIKAEQFLLELEENKNDRAYLISVYERDEDDENEERYTIFNSFELEEFPLNGELYYRVDSNIFDIFRVGGYPDDVLYSTLDVLEYIDKLNKGVYDIKLSKEEVDKIDKFFNENKEGVIYFG